MTDLAQALSVMMPAYNESATLATAIGRVLAQPEVGELIVVDDASTDSTWTILAELANGDPKIRPYRQPVNQGKGAAMRRAITELRLRYAIVQDADLEVDPKEYGGLLRALVDSGADAVFGARTFRATGFSSFLYVAGNKALTFVTNLLFRGSVADMETCYKLLPTDLWQSLPLTASRFDFEPEVTASLLRRGCRIVNVPIRYDPRTASEGKKIRLRDGVQAIGALFRVRFSSARSAAPRAASDEEGRS